MMLAALAVATGVIAAHALGPSGDGELTAIQTWPVMLGTLAMLGLDNALVYFISREPERGKQFTSTAVIIGITSSIALAGVAWFALPLLLSAQRSSVISAARVFLLIGVIYAVVGIPHGSLRGSNSFTAWNIFRVAPGLAWLCIITSSSLTGHANAIPLSRWYLAAVLACGIPILVVVNKKSKGKIYLDPAAGRQMLRFGLPSALTSVPQTINLRFDQLLIIAFLPARLLGFYVVAVAWSGGVAPLLSAVGSVLFPHVSAERNVERQGHLLARALQSGILVAAVTSLPFIALAPFCLPLIFGARFAPAIPSALVLVPAGALLAWSGIAEEGLRGLGRPGIVLFAEIAAAAVTLAALPVLLALDGILGAAIASLLGYGAIALFVSVAISRITDQRLYALIMPTWPVTHLLVVRSVSLMRARRRLPGRHRQGGVRWAKT
jgi:O-antigen/teichoic acid export membrane protein